METLKNLSDESLTEIQNAVETKVKEKTEDILIIIHPILVR